MVGEKINNLTIIEDLGIVLYKSGKGIERRMRRVIVQCVCGKTKNVCPLQLKIRNHVSCGCMNKGGIKHGLRHHPLYMVYESIKKRCYNAKDKAYGRYGERGIKMCYLWLNDFTSFYNWANDNGYKKGLQIDRINNDGDYAPGNCRFVTPKENSNNRSNNVHITWKGETKTVSQWSCALNISAATIKTRLFTLNWDIDKAFTTRGKDENGKKANDIFLELHGKRQTLVDWSKEINIDSETLRRRIFNYKWTVERALTTPTRKYI